MELKNFVSQTLIEIASGVSEAKEKFKTLGGEINPQKFMQVEGGMMYGKEVPIRSEAKFLSSVQFEIALTEGNKEGVSGGIGVFLGGFNVGGKTDQSSEQQSFTKVKFNVLVSLP